MRLRSCKTAVYRRFIHSDVRTCPIRPMTRWPGYEHDDAQSRCGQSSDALPTLRRARAIAAGSAWGLCRVCAWDAPGAGPRLRASEHCEGDPPMMDAQLAPALPRLNDAAPEFAAMTTHGPKKLSDYTAGGKWVLLFSHPADFTPVCTTEFIEFSRLAPEFEKRNVQPIGLSVDSIYSHLGWEQNIEKNFGQKIPFPVIADRNMAVAALYGLIHPGASDTATVRAVFLIDPTGKVRFLIYYPLSMGRNSQEILR